uniref:Uncharacterized protein n=2 Tax=Chrysotila carterae TaxID=13221 RepID=A0A7S4BMU0_CHRCT
MRLHHVGCHKASANEVETAAQTLPKPPLPPSPPFSKPAPSSPSRYASLDAKAATKLLHRSPPSPDPVKAKELRALQITVTAGISAFVIILIASFITIKHLLRRPKGFKRVSRCHFVLALKSTQKRFKLHVPIVNRMPHSSSRPRIPMGRIWFAQLHDAILSSLVLVVRLHCKACTVLHQKLRSHTRQTYAQVKARMD